MTDLRKAAEMALEDICGAKLCELNSMSSRAEMLRLMDKAAEALRQALAEPANSTTGFVEPVAWIEKHKDYLAVSADPFENAIPVYTAPPKCEWVGLTEDEFEKILKTHNQATTFAVYLSIEAKLKEKNT